MFDNAIAYIEAHTDLTKDEIKKHINESISQIGFKDEYPEDPNGIEYVDNIYGELKMYYDLEDEIDRLKLENTSVNVSEQVNQMKK